MMHEPQHHRIDAAADDDVATSDALDAVTRRSRLMAHLGRLVRRGATVEEEYRFQAVVSMPRGSSLRRMVPNALMALVGTGLYLLTDDPLFLVAAGFALLGWHRKVMAGASRVRLMVRVDDFGSVIVRELG